MEQTRKEELRKEFESSFTVLHKEQPPFYTNKIFDFFFKIIESQEEETRLIQEQEFINLITYFTDKTPQRAKLIVREWEESGRQNIYDK